jgi:hypothetical protein
MQRKSIQRRSVSRKSRSNRRKTNSLKRGGELQPSVETCNFCFNAQCNMNDVPSFCQGCNMDKKQFCSSMRTLKKEIKQSAPIPRMNTEINLMTSHDAIIGYFEAAVRSLFIKPVFDGKPTLKWYDEQINRNDGQLTQMMQDFLMIYLVDVRTKLYQFIERVLNKNEYVEQINKEVHSIDTPYDLFEAIDNMGLIIRNFSNVYEMNKTKSDSDILKYVLGEAKKDISKINPALKDAEVWKSYNPFDNVLVQKTLPSLSPITIKFINLYLLYKPGLPMKSSKGLLSRFKNILRKKEKTVYEPQLVEELQNRGYIRPNLLQKLRERLTIKAPQRPLPPPPVPARPQKKAPIDLGDIDILGTPSKSFSFPSRKRGSRSYSPSKYYNL